MIKKNTKEYESFVRIFKHLLKSIYKAHRGNFLDFEEFLEQSLEVNEELLKEFEQSYIDWNNKGN